MQIPANFDEASIGATYEKDSELWKVVRKIDQTSSKGGVVLRERYIQLLSESGKVGFHTFSVEVVS